MRIGDKVIFRPCFYSIGSVDKPFSRKLASEIFFEEVVIVEKNKLGNHLVRDCKGNVFLANPIFLSYS